MFGSFPPMTPDWPDFDAESTALDFLLAAKWGGRTSAWEVLTRASRTSQLGRHVSSLPLLINFLETNYLSTEWWPKILAAQPRT